MMSLGNRGFSVRMALWGAVFCISGLLIDSVASAQTVYDGLIRDRGGAVFNVKSSAYGAAGDGSTRDTDAIAAAIAAVPATGGIVLFPPGTYMIDTINLNKPNLTFIGSGAIIKKRDDNAPNGTLDHMFKDTAGLATGFSCYGLRFDMSRSFFSGGTVSAFFFIRTNDLRFIDCEFKNGIEEGLKLYKCQRVIIDRCHFENIYDGGVQIHSPISDGHTGSRNDQDSAHVRVTNSYFKDIDDGLYGAGNGCGVMVYNTSTTVTTRDILVQGNIFIGCLRGVWAEDNDSVMRRILVQNNDFIGAYSGMPGNSGHGAGFVSVVQGSISGNTFHNIGTFIPSGGTSSEIAAIIISGGTGTSDLVRVVDNDIYDDRGGSARMQFGVYVTKAADLTIKNNRVRGSTQKNVHVVDWANTSGTVIDSEKPVARLGQASAQAINSASWTTANWTSETYDNDNMHDNSTNPSRVTAERSGRYRFSFSGGFVSNSTGFRGARLIRSDGTVFGQTLTPTVNGDEVSYALVSDIDLNAGQYVTVSLYQNSGVSLSTQGGNPRMSLSVEWLEEK